MFKFLKKCYSNLKPSFSSIIDAKIKCIKPLSFTSDIALFVTHCPHQTLKKHVVFYINSLIKQNIPVVLIIATNLEQITFPKNFIESLNGCFIRQNQGFDFAAFAHVLKLFPKLYQSKTLYLVNDSVLGPINQEDFSNMIIRIKQSKADFIRLTQNFQEYQNTKLEERYPLHFQSYFLVFKSNALSSDVMQNFFSNMVSYHNKKDVIYRYEIKLTQTIIHSNLTTQILFPLNIDQPDDPTVIHWESLIENRFPFIKRNIIADSHPLRINNQNWKNILINKGFDLNKIDFEQLTYFKNQPEKKHCIYQIYFKQEHISKLDDAFIPLDNSSAPYPFVFEYNIFKKIYEESLHKKYDLIGALSWKFTQKTSTSGHEFLQHIEKNPGYDIYFINPSQYENQHYQNIWTSAEEWHPGILAITQQILNDLNYDIDLLKIDYPMSKVGYCNFWVGNQSFWDKYMAFTLPIYSYVLYKNKNMYEIIFKKMFHLNGSTYYPYIFERLLTVLLTIDTSIKAYKIPSTQDS